MRVLIAEDVAGDNQQIVADGFGDKLACRTPRRFGEYVESAAGTHDLKSVLEAGIHKIALPTVGGGELRSVAIQGSNACILNNARGADERELLELDHLFDNALRPVDIAQSPARHAIRLAEAVEDNDLLIELRGTVVGGVITESAVDLVAEQKDVAFARQQSEIAER